MPRPFQKKSPMDLQSTTMKRAYIVETARPHEPGPSAISLVSCPRSFFSTIRSVNRAGHLADSPHRDRRAALWQGFLTRARYARLPASKPRGSEKRGWRAILARSARWFVTLATERLRAVGGPHGTRRWISQPFCDRFRRVERACLTGVRGLHKLYASLARARENPRGIGASLPFSVQPRGPAGETHLPG